jgi:hypothetical protein
MVPTLSQLKNVQKFKNGIFQKDCILEFQGVQPSFHVTVCKKYMEKSF